MSELDKIITLRPNRKTGKSPNITQALLTHLRARKKSDEQSRYRPRVEKGILSDKKFSETFNYTQQHGFHDVLKTTLGNNYSQQGLLRPLTSEDLKIFDQKINALQGKYARGVRPNEVIQSALAVDRARATKEIPWAHPISSRYENHADHNKTRLIVTFTTAASGKNGTNKHFVNVAFTQFQLITTHRLMIEPDKQQVLADINMLKNSLIEFDCDCGRHTYWYRYIASIGGFAYIGSNPKGRGETGFPKIRNPKKGIACKHVLRTMHEILNGAGFKQFMVKTILKRYKSLGGEKDFKTSTTKRDFEASIKRQIKGNNQVLSEKELRVNNKLRERYQSALLSGILIHNARDKRTPSQKLATLAKLHNTDNYLNLIKG